MDYHLRPLGKVCAGTGEPLEPGSRVISVLVDRDEELTRLDYSHQGWQGPPEGTLGQWHAMVPLPEREQAKTLDPEAMFAYFEQIVEETNPMQQKLTYVLALFLLQKRRLRLEGSRVDGEIEYLILTGSHGEGPYDVRDQQMSETEIQQLQAELKTVLLGDLAA